VPFGNRKLVGLVTAVNCPASVAGHKLKTVLEVLDPSPVLAGPFLRLLNWAAGYYHHPLGEVIDSALPLLLRQGKPATKVLESEWLLTSTGMDADLSILDRAPRQKELLQHFRDTPGHVLGQPQLTEFAGKASPVLRGLLKKGLVVERQRQPAVATPCDVVKGPTLNNEQEKAIRDIQLAEAGFSRHLLYGITGSGKTEVYLKLIQDVVDQGKQVLVMVPEIGLTPQLVDRFRSRLNASIGLYHSGLSERERMDVWLGAREDENNEIEFQVVLGTRSAVFLPMSRLGMVIIDEEHDASFKQQEGFRYHARDLANVRARDAAIPIVLGSATPSLESLLHAEQGSYRLHHLPARTGAALLPEIRIVDLKKTQTHAGLSPQMIQAMDDTVRKGEQCIVFLNRRGYAPVYMCHACGWLAPCPRCDSRLVFHKASARLRCHHCATEQKLPDACPVCGATELHPLGEGTERLEEVIHKQLGKTARILRLDRDSTRRKGSFESFYKKILDHEVDIIVGTQMLAKGHDFPNVTLVVIVNVDQGLYSLDFRASEHLMQQTMQVSGRAGRGQKAGTVLLQTYHPEHEVFSALKHHDYRQFASAELTNRQRAGFPPYTCIALLRAEAVTRNNAMAFLQAARQSGLKYIQTPHRDDGIEMGHVVPAPMEKRAGRYRAQLLLKAKSRKSLHQVLNPWVQDIEQAQKKHRVRWSIDIDPVDLY